MKQQQYTPGPWEVDKDSSWVNGPNDEIICEVYCDALKKALCIEFYGYGEDDYPLPEKYEGEELETARRIADARLISAAPDLLEALIEVVGLAKEMHEHWDNDRDMKVGKYLLALSGMLPGYDGRTEGVHKAIAKALGE